jgi:hypothetical protein
VELHAEGAMALNARYAALFEPNVRSLKLDRLPELRAERPDYPGELAVVGE